MRQRGISQLHSIVVLFLGVPGDQATPGPVAAVLLRLLPQVQKQVILGQAHLRCVTRTEGPAHAHHRVAVQVDGMPSNAITGLAGGIIIIVIEAVLVQARLHMCMNSIWMKLLLAHGTLFPVLRLGRVDQARFHVFLKRRPADKLLTNRTLFTRILHQCRSNHHVWALSRIHLTLASERACQIQEQISNGLLRHWVWQKRACQIQVQISNCFLTLWTRHLSHLRAALLGRLLTPTHRANAAVSRHFFGFHSWL
eukprot:Skav207231  [mRNA]  locus=scaffold523:20486:33654:- [translate_table: standard]